MTNTRRLQLILLVSTLLVSASYAQADSETYLQRGEALYNQPASCVVCHRQDGTGLIGPDITYGPTAAQILEQRAQLISARAKTETDLVFPKTARDEAVEAVQTWDLVISDWQRRLSEGSIFEEYYSQIVATFDPGKAKFKPKKGKTYFYENVGNSANLAILGPGATNAKSTQVVVGDARTHKVMASYESPVSLRAAVHTTIVSADGKYVYIVGSKPNTEPTNQIKALDAPATLLKVDAVTLQPILQQTMGGRLHHGMVYRDKYVLLDTFSRDPDGLDVMLLDPETDKIIGGVRDQGGFRGGINPALGKALDY